MAAIMAHFRLLTVSAPELCVCASRDRIEIRECLGILTCGSEMKGAILWGCMGAVYALYVDV